MAAAAAIPVIVVVIASIGNCIFYIARKFQGVACFCDHNDYFEDYCPVLFPVCALLMFIGNVNICSFAIVYLPCYTHTSQRVHTYVACILSLSHTHGRI